MSNNFHENGNSNRVIEAAVVGLSRGCKQNVEMKTHLTVMLLLLCVSELAKKNPPAASLYLVPMTEPHTDFRGKQCAQSVANVFSGSVCKDVTFDFFLRNR